MPKILHPRTPLRSAWGSAWGSGFLFFSLGRIFSGLGSSNKLNKRCAGRARERYAPHRKKSAGREREVKQSGEAGQEPEQLVPAPINATPRTAKTIPGWPRAGLVRALSFILAPANVEFQVEPWCLMLSAWCLVPGAWFRASESARTAASHPVNTRVFPSHSHPR